MPTTIQGITFYDVAETANVLQVTPQTVRAYIKAGRMKSQRIGRPVLITKENLHEFLTPIDKN